MKFLILSVMVSLAAGASVPYAYIPVSHLRKKKCSLPPSQTTVFFRRNVPQFPRARSLQLEIVVSLPSANRLACPLSKPARTDSSTTLVSIAASGRKMCPSVTPTTTTTSTNSSSTTHSSSSRGTPSKTGGKCC